MHVEVLVYIYLIVCLSMIGFNCACIIVFKRREKNVKKHAAHFSEEVREQIKRLKNGEDIEEEHCRYLRRKLKRIGNLVAFDETLEAFSKESPVQVRQYLNAISQVILYLTLVYSKKRDNTVVTFFPYIISKYKILQGVSLGPVIEMMFNLVKSPSVYCRENALQALYSTGDADCIVRAVKYIDENHIDHNAKLLTDGMLNFAGNAKYLQDRLWRELDSFSVPMKVMILNYFRFGGFKEPERMLKLLEDETQNREIHFACVRYFAKYPYEPAYALLLEMAGGDIGDGFEYAAIASTALGSYPSEKTMEVLKNNLHHKNWYIRFNSSQSLEKLGFTYQAMIDIMEGSDRYAREMLQYRLDQRNNQNGEALV